MTASGPRELRERLRAWPAWLWSDTGPHPLAYRPDIDGLRAIAILPVMLYHAGSGLFSGGYVGVDVFFVISGYLITGIVAGQVDAGNFSLLTFYERRTRRIIPALLAVMAAVMAISAFLYLPTDFARLPASVVATLAFCSNIFFTYDSGYFADASHVKPLLHTWSLAVEEQFYLFFPPLLILIHRHAARWRIWILAVLGAFSFVLGVVLTRTSPDFAFYMLPTRAWELTVGALLALGAFPAVTSSRWRELLAAAGLAAILAACLLFKPSTDFPGFAALLPVAGAALLIHLAPGTFVGRMISRGPMVFIGLISYSLYLWHWPIIVFLGYEQGVELSSGQAALAIGLTFIASILSWRFVERPFRSATRVSRKRLFQGAAAGTLLLAAAAVAIVGGKGWPSRFSPEVVRLDAFSKASSPMRDRCHRFDLSDEPYCVLGAKAPPVAAVWSDSHGVELAYAIGERLAPSGRSVRQYSYSSCPPVLGLKKAPRGCGGHNERAYREILANPSVRTVILAAHWSKGGYARKPEFAADLDRTITLLRRAGKQVIVVGPAPPNDYDVPRRLAILESEGRLGEARGMTRAGLANANAYLAPLFDRLPETGVPVVRPADFICPGNQCLLIVDGQPLYFDRHHLSLPAARKVSGMIIPMLPVRPD